MDGKLPSKMNIKQYFTSDAWTALTEYEKRRYENVQKNYDFLMAKGNQEPKAQFKLFTSPQKTVSKHRKSNAGASSDISVVIETETPSSKTSTITVISLQDLKPNEFALKFLNSAQNTLKILDDLLGEIEEDIPLDIKKDIPLFEEEMKLSKSTFTKFKDIEPQHRYPKRNIAKKYYKEENRSSEDEFIYCDTCNKDYKGSCPVHGPLLLVCDTKVPKGDPDRAKRTLPYFFSIGKSSLPKAGLGVWTEVPLIAGMVFGPYEGKIIKKNEDVKKSGYAWEVRKQSKTHHYVEAKDTDSSNWMRYVNSADYEEWQNVVAFQYKSEIYYKTYKPVLPFTEILVWYGDNYGSELGKNMKNRKCLQLPKEITGFSCDQCNCLFSSSESLQSHQKTHTRMQPQSDRKHRCPHCPYSSDVARNLCRHLLTHSGEKAHACPQCPKRFTLEHHLRRHLLQHSGRKDHGCETCGRRFSFKSSLVQHERVHTGDRPYRCPYCGKDFVQSCHLQVHLRLHTRQRPYPCTHCMKRFTQSSSLAHHVASIHTKIFPYNCALCEKGFNVPGRLKKHAEKEHAAESGNQEVFSVQEKILEARNSESEKLSYKNEDACTLKCRCPHLRKPF